MFIHLGLSNFNCDNFMKTILLTGTAGFIGFWTAQALLDRGETVIGLDNFNDYYDPQLKRNRVKRLKPAIAIHEVDVSDAAGLKKVFSQNKIDVVCHLAAQAGVGHSLKNPYVYESSNNLGTLNILEM